MRRPSADIFDVAFGLGSACSCTQTLRAAGLQFASFPLDWLLGSDLVSRTALLLRSFDGAFDASDFEAIANPGAFRHAAWRNRRTNLSHFHDFEQGASLAAQLPAVREKYVRRCARLLNLLSKARRALVVWIGDPRDAHPISDEDIALALGMLKERFPQVAFQFLSFDYVAGLPVESLHKTTHGAVTRIAFDYRRYDAKNAWTLCLEWLLPHLRPYAVADYRTPEEKRAFARQERERDRARFPAMTFLGYLATKFQFKLYRHLRKRLERRGVVM